MSDQSAGPAQVMHDGCEEDAFRVAAGVEGEFLGDDEGEQCAADDIVHNCGYIVHLHMCKSFERELGDRELHTSYCGRWDWRHDLRNISNMHKSKNQKSWDFLSTMLGQQRMEEYMVWSYRNR